MTDRCLLVRERSTWCRESTYVQSRKVGPFLGRRRNNWAADSASDVHVGKVPVSSGTTQQERQGWGVEASRPCATTTCYKWEYLCTRSTRHLFVEITKDAPPHLFQFRIPIAVWRVTCYLLASTITHPHPHLRPRPRPSTWWEARCSIVAKSGQAPRRGSFRPLRQDAVSPLRPGLDLPLSSAPTARLGTSD